MRNLLTRRSQKAQLLIAPGPTKTELEQIINSGIRVPDHGRLSPWRIININKNSQKQLGDKFAEIYQTEHPNANSEQIELERQKPQRAPTLLIIIGKQIEHHKIPIWEQTLSTGAMCQNILNAANILGYKSQWLTEWPAYNKQVQRYLEISKNEKIAGFIYIGSSNSEPIERKRANISDVITER